MSGYAEQSWADGVDGGTPITAARLGHIEDGINASVQDDELDGAVATLANAAGSQTQAAIDARVVSGVNAAPTVNPSGNWNFATQPTVAGGPIVATPGNGSVTDAKVATGAAISADKLADGTVNKIMTADERAKLAGLATVATTGAYADLSGRYTDENAVDAVAAALVAGDSVTITYNDAGNTITIDAATGGLTSISWADMPAGSVGRVVKTAGVWPTRPTSRTDVMFIWQGADPAPSVGGTGMLDYDEHHVTP
jgi:hypothetical protein